MRHEPPRVRRNIIAKSEAIAVRLQKICIPHSEKGLSFAHGSEALASVRVGCMWTLRREKRPDAACYLGRQSKQTIYRLLRLIAG